MGGPLGSDTCGATNRVCRTTYRGPMRPSAESLELPGVLAEVLPDPRLSWLATRYATTLVRDLGALGLPTIFADPTRNWPVLPLSDGPAARCVYLPAFLATVPQIRALHRARGLTDDVSWATLADLGRQISIHRRTFGVLGT